MRDTLVLYPTHISHPERGGEKPYLRDALLVLSPEEDGPGNTAGVLALEEQRFGFAILESEDFAVTTNVELALYTKSSAFYSSPACPAIPKMHPGAVHPSIAFNATGLASYLSRVDSRSGEGIVVGTHIDCCVDIRRLC